MLFCGWMLIFLIPMLKLAKHGQNQINMFPLQRKQIKFQSRNIFNLLKYQQLKSVSRGTERSISPVMVASTDHNATRPEDMMHL